ncbi:hypothetical protein B0T17DRAFT_642417 [Bombardia bombarda]|uniref:Protein transport protein BOS1 n=1 Tax=Bombardia bombarda TaxID=252184 RepID=A0AA39WUR8_9PEZI|nr:hypothetical protein B0T17DRAFT_642417 [Bombardia bombarda]
MNTHFNSALKQSTSIRRDLSALSSPNFSSADDPSQPPAQQLTPAAIGALSASLTAFSRTVDEYAALAKHEANASKKDKALERIRNFRAELHDFRAQLDALKAAREDAAHAQNRAELLGRRPFTTHTPENPYANAGGSSSGAGGGGGGGLGSGDVTRESHALREQDFFQSTHSALDDYIARGQAVLGDLGQQRDMLKSTQRKLYSVGNTLGISGDTIRMIDRRARQDKWIFWAGVVVFVLFCWGVVHFLR